MTDSKAVLKFPDTIIPEVVTVPDTVKTATALQALIDKTGDKPVKYVFNQNHNITIDHLIRLYNYTEWDGNGCKFTLMKDAPTNIFGVHIPMIGSKFTKGTQWLIIHGFYFYGNRYQQAKVPYWKGHDGKSSNKQHGQGYHDFIVLGSITAVSCSNSANCEFYNLTFRDNLGDWIRPEGGKNIICHDIEGSGCGHDGINYSGVDGGEIFGIKAILSVGAGIRTRSCKNLKIYDNDLDNSEGDGYSPGIQIQSSADHWTSEEIYIFCNIIRRTYGPAIQVAGSVPGNGWVYIHNNLFIKCGDMPASNNRPVVGAVAYIGFSVNIHHNTVDECKGYGFVAGAYDRTSKYPGEAIIEKNIITKTQPANKKGTKSGTGIANLVGSQYTITVKDNCQYGNTTANHYGVKFTGSISKDPLYVGGGDYHLQEASPCRSEGSQLGYYEGWEETTVNTPTPNTEGENQPPEDNNGIPDTPAGEGTQETTEPENPGTETESPDSTEPTEPETTEPQTPEEPEPTKEPETPAEPVYIPVRKTETEILKRFSTVYTSYSSDSVQRVFKLTAGERTIRLDAVSLELAASQKGYTACARVTYQASGGQEVVIREWCEVDTKYHPKVADALNDAFLKGKDVTIRFSLKTTNKKYRAYMMEPTVTYTLI